MIGFSVLEKLEGNDIATTNADRVLWKHKKDRNFSVSSAYKRGMQLARGGTSYQWNYFWKSIIPTKINVSLG